MRFSKMVLVCICLLGLTQPARSQQTEGSQKKEGAAEQGIPGYLDPRTGAFKPMAKAPLEESDIEVTSTAGDFKVTYNITVKSSIPSTAPVLCTFETFVSDIGSGLTMSDTMTVAATGSGSSRSCSLDMFYSWPLSTPGNDMVTLSYSVDATGTGTGTFKERVSTQSLPSKKPANGQTAITISATI